MIVGDWIGRRAQLTPNKVALVDTLNGNRPITYREWSHTVNRTARFLQDRLGVRKGDRVAILAHNCVEYLDLWFALGRIGGILQTLNWRLTPYELEGLLRDGAPVALVYGEEFAETVDRLRERMPGPIRYVSLGTPDKPSDLPFFEREDFSDAPLPEVDLDWDDPWVICYTGGTTGLPKGAVLTHRAITANAVNTIVSWGLTPDDVAILNAPLFHTGGLNVFTAPLVYIGGTSIVCKGFAPDQVFDLIRDAGVTLFFGVPTMFIMLQQHPRWEEADFSRLKIVISGGAPCPLPVFERFWERGVDFKTGYGLTEAGPNTFWLPPEDVRRKPGSVGFPLFHIDVRVVREDGSECGPNEVGELIIRGPHVCAGYWNNPQATAQTIRNGWLYTGDLARYDEEGYYYIVGRLKDMIISGGENVYPAEVESILHAHPAVAEAALIGVPDEKWGEVGRAIVVLHPGAQVTAEEILTFCRERLASYKVPKSVIFVDELPKTGANKVDKERLRKLYGT
ncbi:MAG: acyl-CoA synthetase [Anaerolineae bacterium]